MLALVMGVGSRLIPALLGRAPLPIGLPAKSGRSIFSHNPFVLLGILFALSYPAEVFFSGLSGPVLRALIGAWIGLRYWQLHKLPESQTRLSKGLWFSSWFTVLGLCGSALFPAYGIHFLHLTFISGLGLMTLMVATRVVLAHGGFSLMLESRLSSLYWVSGVLAVAALARLSAGLFTNSYSSHLVAAAMLWLAGLSIWSASLGWRIFKPLAADKTC
jgi:hypothetical protein